VYTFTNHSQDIAEVWDDVVISTISAAEYSLGDTAHALLPEPKGTLSAAPATAALVRLEGDALLSYDSSFEKPSQRDVSSCATSALDCSRIILVHRVIIEVVLAGSA
jgi:hypothetical protein